MGIHFCGVPVHGFFGEKGISAPKIGHPFLPTFSIFRFHLDVFSVSSVPLSGESSVNGYLSS